LKKSEEPPPCINTATPAAVTGTPVFPSSGCCLAAAAAACCYIVLRRAICSAAGAAMIPLECPNGRPVVGAVKKLAIPLKFDTSFMLGACGCSSPWIGVAWSRSGSRILHTHVTPNSGECLLVKG
jgi:hypothetical protein